VVSVKGCHHAGCLPEATPYPLRFAAIVADPTMGARMPIWTYVIVHPQGVFVIDAGATPDFNDDASWAAKPVDGALVRGFLRLDVTPEETLPAQLKRLGVDPGSVKGLVLTHQHLDHTGSVKRFPAADVWTSRAERDAALFIGSNPWRWSSAQTRFREVDAEARPGATPWSSVALTDDGRLELFSTPGHTPGSVTARLKADEGEVWFVGDFAFRAVDLLEGGPTSGIHSDVSQVRQLQRWLRERPPLAVLAAHDAAVPDHLAALHAGP
jgi:glyoxylase-like metal-dependent hydrolase (beta-lactamase superfamily II)